MIHRGPGSSRGEQEEGTGEAGGPSPQPCRAHLPVGASCRQVGEHLPSSLHAKGCLTWAQQPGAGAPLPPDGHQEASAAALMVGGQAPLHPASG